MPARRKPLTDDDPRHGTPAGRWAHKREGTPYCPPCRAEWRRPTPEQVAKKHARERERYASDPDYRANLLERQRQRRAADPERKRAADRKYIATPEQRAKRLVRAKEWAINHPERAAANSKRSHDNQRARMTEEERELRRAQGRQRYHADPEASRAKGRIAGKQFRQRHPDRAREMAVANRHQRRALIAKVPRVRYKPSDIYERDGWICYLCLEPVDPSLKGPDPMSKSIDHVRAIVNGGGDTPDNVKLAHLGCNSRKNARRAPIRFLFRNSSKQARRPPIVFLFRRPQA